MPTITFPNSPFAAIALPPTASLCDYLTVENSPVLFGCRTGLCGTCLVEIQGDIVPPTADEQEILETIAPHQPNARLACQIHLTQDITIHSLH